LTHCFFVGFSVKEIEGNLPELAKDGEFDVIFHACHCQCYMYSGVAQAISDIFPEAFNADKKTKKDDPGKLGTYTHAVGKTNRGAPIVIFNLYVQRYYGKLHYQQGNYGYDFLEQALLLVKRRVGGKGLRFGFPLIGDRRGGADIERVNEIIANTLDGEDLTLVLYQPKKRRVNKTNN